MAYDPTSRPSWPLRCGWQAQEGHHYTVSELAEAWNLSVDFVRDLFRDEDGVVRWVRKRAGRRRYVTLRIPADVAARVYRQAQGAP
jgi:hypothetical protein